MREIKFRAWDKKDNQMEYPKYYGKTDIEGLTVFLDWLAPFKERGEDYILMQYTGLKDKNGREIYEGSIVRHRFRMTNGSKNWVEETIYPVEWKFIGWNIQHGFEAWGKNSQIEIIGNIYENPELLKEK